MPVVLYGCETWSVTIKQEHKLRVITTRFLDFVHHPDFHKQENTTFRKLDLFQSSGEGGTYSTKNQKLTLPEAMSDQKKVNHSKQGD
jgi:hypothetical protein